MREPVATGEPVGGTLTNGSSPVTSYSVPYEVRLPKGASEERQIEVARDVTLSFLHGYEQNSVVLGGVGNRAAEWLGAGTSAFSTEDVVSNAVGVFWAEDLARGNGIDALLQVPPETLTRYVLGQTALEAGNVMSIGPDTVSSFGNRDYLPNFRHGHERPLEARRESALYRYLEERQDAYETIGDFAPARGGGWTLEPPPEPVVPHEGTLWAPTGDGW